MKTLWSVLAALLVVAPACIAAPEPKGVFKFQSVGVMEILAAYRDMTGVELVIAPTVANTPSKISLESNGHRSASEAAQMIERALIEQAGIVITRLGDRRVSVAFGERLALESLARQSRLNSQRILPDYEVRGEVSWIGRDGKYVEGGKRTSGFTVCVKGSQWSVTVFPSNWPVRVRFDKEVPVPLSSTMSSDGTNGYHLERYPPPNPQVADRWISNTPTGKGSTRELYPLWYAFASHNYCRSLTNDNILPLEPGPPPMRGVLQTNTIFPHLPASIIGTNSKQTLRWDFAATSFTNVFGLSLPSEVVVGYTAIFNSTEPWSTVVLKVREVHPRCAMTSFVPDLNHERTVINDWTYKNGNPPHEAQIVTNRWPTAAEVSAFYFR